MRVLCIIRQKKILSLLLVENSQAEGNFKFPSRVLPENRNKKDTLSMLFLLSFDAESIIHLRYLA